MDNTSNEAEEAIKYLYRLDVFDEISRANRQILTAIQDAEGGARGTDRSVRVLRTKQSDIKETIDRLLVRQKELQADIVAKQATQADLESRISKIDEKYKDLSRENYHCDEEGTALNYAVISDVVRSVRMGVEIESGWKKRIEEDFKNRR